MSSPKTKTVKPPPKPSIINPYRLKEARVDALRAGAGFSTGFVGLDKVDFRFQPGQLYAIAGRPGQGKTALVLDMMMKHVKERHKRFIETGKDDRAPAVFVTYEVTRELIYTRLLLRQFAKDRDTDADVPNRREALAWIRGEHDSEWRNANEENLVWAEGLAAAAAILDLYADDRMLAIVDGDRDGGDVDRLLDSFEDTYDRLGKASSLVVIDYFQKVRVGDKLRRAGRQEQLQYVADRVRRFAKGEAGHPPVAVLVAAQVNREATNGQPELEHIREADDLANDAAGILTIHQPEEEKTVWPQPCPLNLKVVKNRDGQRGETVKLLFHGLSGRFTEEDEQPSKALGDLDY